MSVPQVYDNKWVRIKIQGGSTTYVFLLYPFNKCAIHTQHFRKHPHKKHQDRCLYHYRPRLSLGRAHLPARKQSSSDQRIAGLARRPLAVSFLFLEWLVEACGGQECFYTSRGAQKVHPEPTHCLASLQVY